MMSDESGMFSDEADMFRDESDTKCDQSLLVAVLRVFRQQHWQWPRDPGHRPVPKTSPQKVGADVRRI